jgi:IS5 family transposase
MKGSLSSQSSFNDLLIDKKVNQNHILIRVDKLLNWRPIEHELGRLYSDIGRPSHPPIVLFKMLLLQSWYSLSDEACEEACSDRLSFRKFLGVGLDGTVPEETALVRFRQRIQASAALEEKLLDMVNDQLGDRGYKVKKVTLVDASLIQSAS